MLLSELDALAEGRLSALATVVARARLLLGSFWLLAVRAVPHLISWVARTRSTELFLLVALAVAVGTAVVTQALGLSLALGAFLAGLAIGGSEYAHETLARLLPLRETFRGLLFRRARALNPRVPVLARAHVPEVAERPRADGATDVIQPELEAGLTLIRHALGELALPREPLVSYVEALRDALGGARTRGAPARRGLPEVRELVVEPGALADQSLADARVRERFGVSVLRVERSTGAVEACPDARTILRVGDRIRVFGLLHQIAALETALRTPE